jgi:capsular polysaccharide biosynthesis protein
MKEYGFETLHFEDLSFGDQALISLNAKYLVSNHGAGLTNILFMSEGNSVLELRQADDRQNNCYFSLASALGLKYFYQTCSSPNPEEDAHTADLLVDLPTLQKNLELMLSHSCSHSNSFDRESMIR